MLIHVAGQYGIGGMNYFRFGIEIATIAIKGFETLNVRLQFERSNAPVIHEPTDRIIPTPPFTNFHEVHQVIGIKTVITLDGHIFDLKLLTFGDQVFDFSSQLATIITGYADWVIAFILIMFTQGFGISLPLGVAVADAAAECNFF